jgi:hypothetical protein
MSAEEARPWIEYLFPLAALRLERDEVMFQDAVLARPTLEEWRLFEKTDVADMLVMPALAGVSGAETPYCIWVPRELDKEPEPDDVTSLWPEAKAIADDLLYALWLHKAGDLPPPELVCLYARTSNGWSIRQPGPYRQAEFKLPGEPYALEEADLTSVTELAELRRAYRRASNPAAEIAFENLRQSYGWYLDSGDRLAMLFAALEALLGGYRPRGPTESPYRQVSMPRRAATAIGDAGIESYLAGPGRELRNAIAHGRPPEGDEAVERVRDVVRQILVLYLEFCVSEEGSGEAKPALRFNRLLAEAAASR